MANPQPGSQVAKELGIYLGQIYGYIKRGSVVNYKEGGYPDGKGIEVDLEEVRSAMSEGRSRRKANGEAKPRATRSDGTPRRMKRSRSIDQPTYHRAVMTPLCPVDPDHGQMISNDDERARKSGKIWMCTHQGHDGRPRATGSPAPATQFSFTDEEAKQAQPVGVLGRVMLDWIEAGHLDLASDLEEWCDERGVDVWIPAR